MPSSDLGARVRTYRTALGLSQQELAGKVGVTRSSISNLEAEQQNISVDLLERIMQALEVTATELLDSSVDELGVVARIGAENTRLREENKILRDRIRYAFEAVSASEGEAEDGRNRDQRKAAAGVQSQPIRRRGADPLVARHALGAPRRQLHREPRPVVAHALDVPGAGRPHRVAAGRWAWPVPAVAYQEHTPRGRR